MRSHLGDSSTGPDGHRILTSAEVDQRAGQGVARDPHGRVVQASQIPRHRHGSQPVELLEDPRRARGEAVGLPHEARNWRGSATHVSQSELPHNDHAGKGFAGTGVVVSAAELDAHEQTQGTSQQPLRPGAYTLPNGNILLVSDQGNQQVVTHQQYQQLLQEYQAQQQRQSLAGRVLGHITGG